MVEPHPLQLPFGPGSAVLRARPDRHVLGGDAALDIHHDGPVGALVAHGLRLAHGFGGELRFWLSSYVPPCLQE